MHDAHVVEYKQTLVLEHYWLIWTIIRRHNFPQEEDCVCEAHLALTMAADQYNHNKSKQGDRGFVPYAYTAILRKLWDFRNNAKKKFLVLGSNQEEYKTIRDPEIVDTIALQEKINNLLKYIDKKERYIIEQKFMYGKTLHEIGQELGITRERVRQLLHRTILRIREKNGIGTGENNLISETGIAMI